MKAVLDPKPTAPDRKTLLTAIRAIVKARPVGRPLSFMKFLSASKLSAQDVFRHFSKWNEALLAAGFDFKRHNDPVTSAQMLDDWGRLARTLRRMPTHNEYKLRGNYSSTTMMRRFGAWSHVPDAFRDFTKKGASNDKSANNKRANGTTAHEWSDVLASLPPRGAPAKAYRRRKQHPPGTRPRHGRHRPARIADRPVCGPPLDFAGLRHAPANESGVIFLFGAMARDLGFLIDSFQIDFPDCEAKRLIAPETWQPVHIEFEYVSKNFRDHGHDAKACDLIVCWEHNWPECPEHLEVIALSDELKHVSQ